MGITIQTGITDGTHGITPSLTGITRYTGLSGAAVSTTSNDYAAEDGTTFYVDEGGVTHYVTEH